MSKRVQSYSDIDTGDVCYWSEPEVGWMVYLPGCGAGVLSQHSVTEHEDGTITVHPSILMTGHAKGTATQKHGFLERGVWRDA